MMIAAKTLTLTAIDLLKDKEIIEKAKGEFLQRRGADFEYIPLLGERDPALDYRN
jgi:aminobenzoyl-glutamate utilization protein B